MFTGQPEAAEARADDAERCVQADAQAERTLILGKAALVRGNLARISGDLALRGFFATGVGPITREALHLDGVQAERDLPYQVSGEVTPTTERRVAEVIAPVRRTGNPLTILRSIINLDVDSRTKAAARARELHFTSE